MTADVEHRQGCPATGGYGHGVEPCICGAVTVVELLPLPEWPDEEGLTVHGHPFWKGSQLERYATDYARACVEANTEALRAEVERQKAWLAWWGRFASQQCTRAEQAEAHAEHLVEACRDVEEAWVGNGDMATAVDKVLLALHLTTAQEDK